MNIETAHSPNTTPITAVVFVWLAALSLAIAASWFAFSAVDQAVANATTPPPTQSGGPASSAAPQR